MKQVKLWFSMILLMAGCASAALNPADYPVRIYDEPFDLVYLKTYEALSKNSSEWIPYRTDKANGVIEIRSLKYNNAFGLDKQFARFLVKMVSRTQTSVELDIQASKCKDNECRDLLDMVHETIIHLPARPKKQAQIQ